ncbi:MAG: sigma-70 family RNA polymerase sigma factor [Chloroflexota bacterium]
MAAVEASSPTLEALADEELLSRAADGAQEVMAILFDRYQGSMYALALRISRDPALAQDAVQDAFLGIWRNASRFDAERASARSWMLAIAHHRAVDAVRRRRPVASLDTAASSLPLALIVPDIWTEVRQRLDAAEVREALGRIPQVQREAIELAYFGGLTQREIAGHTDTPIGTVKSRVRLGLLALRAELEAARQATIAGDPAADVLGSDGQT